MWNKELKKVIMQGPKIIIVNTARTDTEIGS